jgi:D-amino-acid dehydrogenase
MAFIRNANSHRLKRTLALFEKYGELSLSLYKEIIYEHSLDFDFYDNGSLLVFTQENTFNERLKTATDESKYKILSFSDTKAYLPFIRENICGSLLLKRNAHLDPALMMRNLKAYLEKAGVEFILNEEIIDFEFSASRLVKVSSKNNDYIAQEFIMCTGAQIELAKKSGANLLLTPAKGYSITFEMPESLKPKMCTMFNDLFIFCSPRRHDVRLTGKLEIGSNNPTVIQKRIDSIVRDFREHTLDFNMKNTRLWTGFRPLTPNDMPLLGRDDTYKNLVYATGLGWLGITFAPAIGKIISDLIVQDIDNVQSDDILLFSGFYQG